MKLTAISECDSCGCGEPIPEPVKALARELLQFAHGSYTRRKHMADSVRDHEDELFGKYADRISELTDHDRVGLADALERLS